MSSRKKIRENETEMRKIETWCERGCELEMREDPRLMP